MPQEDRKRATRVKVLADMAVRKLISSPIPRVVAVAQRHSCCAAGRVLCWNVLEKHCLKLKNYFPLEAR